MTNNRNSIGAGLSQEYARSCAAVLGVRLPAPVSEVKQAYRQLAREHHPDKGGDAAAFRRVKEAYDFIIANAAQCLGDTATTFVGRTVQGDLLSNLGNGLGVRVNGKPCTYCAGRGYQVSAWRDKTSYSTCYTCHGSGEIEMFNPVLPKWRLARTRQGSKPREKATCESVMWTPPAWMTE